MNGRHHSNTRKACASLVFNRYFKQFQDGRHLSEEKIQELYIDLHRSLKVLDEVFLSNTPFLNRPDPSIADILAYQEIVQLDLVDQGLYNDASKYPQLSKWLGRMRSLPFHDEVYKTLRKQVERKQPSAKL
jgi:glutathione S-transferase